jgi:hypothetical protein
MDKVQKHNSFNTNNTPSSESYKNEVIYTSVLYAVGTRFISSIFVR